MTSIARKTAGSATPKTRTNAAAANRDDGREYVPRTEFGRRLLELRQRIIASGRGLRDWDELEREIAEHRGGFAGDNR